MQLGHTHLLSTWQNTKLSNENGKKNKPILPALKKLPVYERNNIYVLTEYIQDLCQEGGSIPREGTGRWGNQERLLGAEP